METAASIFGAVIEIFFLAAFLKLKNNKYSIPVVIVSTVILALEYIFLSQREGWALISEITSFCICFGCALAAFKGYVTKKLSACILIHLGFTLVSPLVLNSVAAVIGLEGVSKLHSAEYSANTRLFVLIVGNLAVLVSFLIILAIFSRVKYEASSKEWGFIAVLFAVTYIITYIVWWSSRSDDRGMSFVYIIISAALIFINVMVIYLLQYLGQLTLKYKEAELSRLRHTEDEKLLKQVKEQYTEARKIKHDMRGCINNAIILIKENRNSEAQEYLQQYLGERVETIVTAIYTESAVINAIINSKLNLCSRNGIKYTCEIIKEIPPEIEFDLSFLITNLMDNAIEACEKMKGNKYIFLSVTVIKAYYHIVIKNTIEGSVLKDNPQLKTTKSNLTGQHGYGILSVRDVIKKHQGSIHFKEDDNFFTVDAIIRKDMTEEEMLELSRFRQGKSHS